MNNENTNNESIIIEDLTAENADEIKGGPSTQSKRNVILKSSVAGEEGDGSSSSNHNETVSEDSDEQETAAEQFADLTVDEVTATELIGGPTSLQWPFYAQNTPGNVLNHNETVSEDSDFQEATTEPLADLAVDQASEAEIKGGPGGVVLLPAVQKAR